jgi:hypothetical protein
MSQSLTDRLQQSRFIVVGIDKQRGHIRVKSHGDACTDVACGESALVLSEEGPAGLETLNPGDIIRLDQQTGRPDRIVVVRRVWDELTSPEF